MDWPPRHLHTRIMVACASAVVASVGTIGLLHWIGVPLGAGLASGTAVGLISGALTTRRALRPARLALRALHDGVVGFAESDFGTRLATSPADELGDIVTVFNRMGDVLRRERASLVQRELLLDTLLQGTPMAIVLLDMHDRVVFANQAARRLLGQPSRLAGLRMDALVDGAPEALRAALRGGEDRLVSWEAEGHDETFRVIVRRFELNAMPHRLLVAERLTADLARQEMQVWKKAIRVMSHEINNSLAPISSMAHSARVVMDRPDARERLPGILEAIGERVARMTSFLDGYARVARLPAPTPVEVDVEAFLEGIRKLFPFTRLGTRAMRPASFDPGQMQQVLINLLKNAEEAGGPRDEVCVEVQDQTDGVTFTVSDRGAGMSDDEMRTALLPFHSSKKTGGGLGLSLCSEIVEAHRGRLQLVRREAGGTAVVVWLPATRA